MPSAPGAETQRLNTRTVRSYGYDHDYESGRVEPGRSVAGRS
jgi:hypothetical protein